MKTENSNEPVESTPDAKVSPDFMKEVEVAVEQSVPKQEKDVKTDLPLGEEKPADPKDVDKGGQSPEEKKGKTKEEKPEPISDDLLTRAVKAGMTIAEARAIPDADALEGVCSKLETAQPKSDKSESKAEIKDDADDENDIFKDLPILDPDDYDEGVIKLFDGLKSIIKNQNKQISTLEKGGESEVSWVDAKIDGLGSDFEEAVGVSGKVLPDSAQAKSRADVKKKFDVLSAGYKAAGETVKPNDVFNEAIQLTLGDVAAAAKATKVKAAAKKRSSHISVPPGGPKGKADSLSPEDEAVAMLNEKFFKNQ
ncbi:MAG: hypothetical protein R6V06_00060 [Kiritimatiellia bacterium]